MYSVNPLNPNTAQHLFLTEESHRLLPQITHFIDQDSYDEIIRTSGRVTNIIVWDSPAKTRKIREEILTRIGSSVSQVVTKQYDNLGILKETLTEVLTRVGGKVSTITRTYV